MTTAPIRIQLRRTKGWRMPPNTVRVCRPGKWGNRFAVGRHYQRGGMAVPRMGLRAIYIETRDGYQDHNHTTIKTAAEAVEWFRWYLSEFSPEWLEKYLAPLRGKNLACWCKPGDPCHADVLLELANRP